MLLLGDVIAERPKSKREASPKKTTDSPRKRSKRLSDVNGPAAATPSPVHALTKSKDSVSGTRGPRQLFVTPGSQETPGEGGEGSPEIVTEIVTGSSSPIPLIEWQVATRPTKEYHQSRMRCLFQLRQEDEDLVTARFSSCSAADSDENVSPCETINFHCSQKNFYTCNQNSGWMMRA
jgi:hypothetical protein